MSRAVSVVVAAAVQAVLALSVRLVISAGSRAFRASAAIFFAEAVESIVHFIRGHELVVF